MNPLIMFFFGYQTQSFSSNVKNSAKLADKLL